MTKKTVYVVGAGASAEANLPAGDELKYKIAKLLEMNFEHGSFSSGNYDLYRALMSHVQNDVREFNTYLHESRHIIANMPLAISIDNFIDSERGNEKLSLCGKIGIVSSILEAEKKSLLYFDRNVYQSSMKFSVLRESWYLPFFQMLTENCKSDDLADRFSEITMIIFNYDRCVEHFLINALKSYYRLDESDAATIISNLTIIHPYGTVGSLQWQDAGSSTLMEYGGEIKSHQLVSYAGRIRTFTEGAHSESMNELRSKMGEANRLVFLGFAYHKINMDLLS